MARWVRWNNPTIKPPFGAQIDWSNPITEGLVGCWLLNENCGIPLNLVTKNIGALINGAQWSNSGLKFDGIDDYVDLDAITINDSEPLSIATKFRMFHEESENMVMVQQLDGAGLGRSYLYRNVQYNQIATYIGGSELRGGQVWYKEKEYTAVLTTDGIKRRLYFEGNLVAGPSSDATEFVNGNIRLGAHKNLSNLSHWNGYIHYVFFYKRQLYEFEIEQIHYEPYPFFLYPQYWYLVDFGGINSKEYSSLYDILNKNEYNNKYDIQTKTEKNIKYDLLAQNSYVSKYDILTKRETDVGYDILAKADYSINYDILNRLTKEVSYDILSAKEYNSRYDVLTSLTTSILYNILTKNEYNVIYDILGTSAIEYTIKYDILNSAQTNIVFDILSKKEANIKYNILASRTSNIIYDILAKTLTNIIYDILAKKETTFSYDIINKKEINFKYDILTAKLYTNIYNILTKSEYKILYDILSDIIIKPEIVFKLDKQDTIFKVGKINTIFKLK